MSAAPPRGLWLSQDGEFWHDGDPVGHAGLQAFLHRCVGRAADGRLVVAHGYEQLDLQCEDLPLRVLGVQWVAAALQLQLSNGHTEAHAHPVFVDRDGRWWLMTQALLPARLTRAAQQSLEACVEEGEDGVFALHAGDAVLALTSQPAPTGPPWR